MYCQDSPFLGFSPSRAANGVETRSAFPATAFLGSAVAWERPSLQATQECSWSEAAAPTIARPLEAVPPASWSTAQWAAVAATAPCPCPPVSQTAANRVAIVSAKALTMATREPGRRNIGVKASRGLRQNGQLAAEAGQRRSAYWCRLSTTWWAPRRSSPSPAAALRAKSPATTATSSNVAVLCSGDRSWLTSRSPMSRRSVPVEPATRRTSTSNAVSLCALSSQWPWDVGRQP